MCIQEKTFFLLAFFNTAIKFSGLSPSFPRPPRRLPRPLPCLPSSVRNIKTMALGCTALILKMFCTFEPFSFYISSPPALNQVDLDLLEKKNNYMASCWDGVEGGDNNDDGEDRTTMVEIIMMNMMILVAMTMIVVFSFRLIFILVTVRICLFL